MDSSFICISFGLCFYQWAPINFFLLSRHTRQGCPLSPLLFALVMEPIAIRLRSSPTFTGISRSGVELKLSLYVDDLLLYVSDPSNSFPAIVSTFQKSSSFLDYKLNISKSECFQINSDALSLEQSDLPFKMSQSSFKYPGIHITRTFYLVAVTQKKQGFQKWEASLFH